MVLSLAPAAVQALPAAGDDCSTSNVLGVVIVAVGQQIFALILLMPFFSVHKNVWGVVMSRMSASPVRHQLR